MLSETVTLFVVLTLVSASNNAWLPETEYVYRVRSRALTSVDNDNTYTGLFYSGDLSIKTGKYKSIEEKLTAKLTNVQITRAHGVTLPNGWESDSITSYPIDLTVTNEPFHIFIKENVISGLLVSSDMSKWEANMIRGIVSQFQMKIETENGCSYKVYEPTVTGEYETLYEFCGPEKTVDGDIHVTKTKNFENARQHPSFHRGYLLAATPNSNRMGDFFTKSSVSNAILNGRLPNRYNITSSETVNEISISPTLNDGKRLMVRSKVNVTLESRKKAAEAYPQPKKPVRISLVFEPSTNFSKYDKVQRQNSRGFYHASKPLSSVSDYYHEEVGVKHPKPSMNSTSFIPYMTEFEAVGYTDNQSVVKLVISNCKEIAKDVKRTEDIMKKETLSKFVILSRIIATLNKEQLKIITEDIYTVDQSTWKIFRDAVSASSTLPAYSTIKDWIKEKKVKGMEAVQVISRVVSNIITPTEEFVRDFFEFTKDSQVAQMNYINDSVILACASLINKVYVDVNGTNLRYPIFTYENFRTKRSDHMVIYEYVPYLTRRLREAFEVGNKHKMNVYIRALGNVGHKSVIPAFDGFWSNSKVPLFQRVLSVSALDRVARMYPRETGEVSFRLYNSEQIPQEMRIAAVYQIIRSNPTKAMLQQMARNTNEDQNEYVNSAVQSAIMEAAKCKLEACGELSKNAQAAIGFLNKNEYGQHYSKKYIESFSNKNKEYWYEAETIGSTDSYFPKFLKFAFGEIQDSLSNIEFGVNSVDELLKTMNRNYENDIDWKKLNVAEMPEAQPKPVEGMIHSNFGNLEHFFSFDSNTIPSKIQDIEMYLKDHQTHQIDMITNGETLYLAAPLEVGSIYIFSVENPSYFSVIGKFTAEFTPKISTGTKLQRPKTFDMRSELELVVVKKIQSRLTIVTSFDHHEYTSGFDRDLQVNVPFKFSVRGDFSDDVKLNIEMEPIPRKSFDLLKCKTRPFLGHRNFLKFEAVGAKTDTLTIISSPAYTEIKTFLRGSGLAIVQNSIAQNPQTHHKFIDSLRKYGFFGMFGDEVDYSDYVFTWNEEESLVRKIVMELGRRALTQRDLNHVEYKIGRSVEKLSDSKFYYLDLELKGNKRVDYYFKLGISQDSVGVRSNYFAIMTKQSNWNEIKPYQAFAWIDVNLPKTTELRAKDVIDTTSKSNGEYLFCVGRKCESKLKGMFELKRSNERKNYLANRCGAAYCTEMENGTLRDYQTCDTLTISSGLLNNYRVVIKKESPDEIYEVIENVYNYHGRILHLPQLPWMFREVQQVETIFSVDLNYVNVTGNSFIFKFTHSFLPVNDWLKSVLVIHPSYSTSSRLFGKYLAMDTYNPMCSIGPVNVNTFDNFIYPIDHLDNNFWYIALNYNGTFSNKIFYRVAIKKENRNYSAMMEIKFPFSNLIQIALSTKGKRPQIKVQGIEMPWNTTDAGIYQAVRYYGINDEELKVKVYDDFYIIFSFHTIKIEATSDRIRGKLKGLCGNNDGLLNNDLMNPKYCLIAKEKFLDSYKLPIKINDETCLYQEKQSHELLQGINLNGNPFKNAKRSY